MPIDKKSMLIAQRHFLTIGGNEYLDHGRCLSGEAARQAAVV